jgi:hypothetical protein
MNTGAAIGIGVGVVAAGGIAFVVLRKKRDPGYTTGTGAAVAGTAGGASASALPGPSSPLDVLNAVNAKACAVVVGSKAPISKGLVQAGCAAYENYLSPIALGVTLPLKVIEKVPVIGGAVKPIEHAVSTATSAALKATAAAPAAAQKILSIGDLPFHTSNTAVNTVSQIALAPIVLGQKTLGYAASGAKSAVHAFTSLF